MPEPGRDAVTLAVVESSQVGEARRLASNLARQLGFDPVLQGRVALIVTELGNNLVRYAEQGELLISPTASAGRPGLEVLAIDRGPGVPDFRRCLADGYSSTATPGNGLGTVARQADRFDAHSVVPKGTVISARISIPPRPGLERPNPHPALDLSAVCVPVAGEIACGDSWSFAESTPGQSAVIVADGLGHGPKAAEASNLAVARFRQSPTASPAEHLVALHSALKATRGAAVAIATIDHDRRELRFAGVGNIAGTLFDDGGQRRGLVSHNGTVGGTMPRVQEFTLPWTDGALLVLHSDGLTSQWRLENEAALKTKAPGVIAGTLYRDFNRGRDDVTVLVARNGGDR